MAVNMDALVSLISKTLSIQSVKSDRKMGGPIIYSDKITPQKTTVINGGCVCVYIKNLLTFGGTFGPGV